MSIRKDFLWYMLFCLHDIWFLQTLIMEKLRYWSYVFGKGKREKRITCNGGCMNEKNREGKTWQSADLNQINPETYSGFWHCGQHLKRHLGFQKGTKKTQFCMKKDHKEEKGNWYSQVTGQENVHQNDMGKASIEGCSDIICRIFLPLPPSPPSSPPSSPRKGWMPSLPPLLLGDHLLQTSPRQPGRPREHLPTPPHRPILSQWQTQQWLWNILFFL